MVRFVLPGAEPFQTRDMASFTEPTAYDQHVTEAIVAKNIAKVLSDRLQFVEVCATGWVCGWVNINVENKKCKKNARYSGAS